MDTPTGPRMHIDLTDPAVTREARVLITAALADEQLLAEQVRGLVNELFANPDQAAAERLVRILGGFAYVAEIAMCGMAEDLRVSPEEAAQRLFGWLEARR